MARIRSIKPEFWSDDTITECSLSARLLFIGIWNFADDAGNLDRSAKQIKARVFPVDNVDCEPLLQELLTHGLLIEYSVSDKKFLHIPGFAKHQVINRPSAPVVPPYPLADVTPTALSEDSVSTHAGREGKGEERKGESPEAPVVEGLNPIAWAEWLTYRREIRKPLKPASMLAAQRKLAAFGPDQAAVVEQSKANAWVGMFPVKHQGKAPTRKDGFVC